MGKLEEPMKEAAIQHLIAERAYELWENQGYPHGHHLLHWRQAEQEIMSCLGQVYAAADRPQRTQRSIETSLRTPDHIR